MKQSKRQFAPGLGVLLLAAVILGAVGFVLHDYNGVQYRVVGTLLWVGALFAAFALGTVYLSRVLLPLPDDPGWSSALLLLWKSYFTGGVRDMTAWYDSAAIMATPDRPPVAPSFDILGTGVLPAHEAVAIVRGTSYVRADGPGLIFLQPGERIAQVIDLRPQVRRQKLTVNSRDGIPLDTSITVTFKVRSPAAPPDDEALRQDQERQPYPYDRDAIFYLHYISTVGEDDEVRPWTEQVAAQAATMLVSEMGRYSLDELTGGGSMRVDDARRAIRQRLEEQYLPMGIQIISVSIGNLQPPPEVMEQRLANWEAEWEAKTHEELVTGDVEAQRLIMQARKRAQVDIIESLVQSIESMHADENAELRDLVMMRIFEVMDQAVTDDSVRAIIPQPLLANGSENPRELRSGIQRREDWQP